jgi:hypothetical protein
VALVNVFGDHRSMMVSKLLANGVDVATGDPAARPPFVLVGLVTTTAAEGIGAWAATVPVTIAVPPPGDAVAADALEELLEAVYVALGFAPARPLTYNPDGQTGLPAYQVAYPASIPNPNC